MYRPLIPHLGGRGRGFAKPFPAHQQLHTQGMKHRHLGGRDKWIYVCSGQQELHSEILSLKTNQNPKLTLTRASHALSLSHIDHSRVSKAAQKVKASAAKPRDLDPQGGWTEPTLRSCFPTSLSTLCMHAPTRNKQINIIRFKIQG